MAKKRWEPGNAISKKIAGWTYYARLLEFPWVTFYHYRTKKLVTDLDEITKKDILFTIATHKSLVANGEWTSIGHRPVEKGLLPPHAQAIWDDPEHCHIIDDKGKMRKSTPSECKGLEPAAVWEPDHVADRLKDAFAGRPNRWLLEAIPKSD